MMCRSQAQENLAILHWNESVHPWIFHQAIRSHQRPVPYPSILY